MNDWTDERLGALLTDTFTAHEGLADSERARFLAVKPPRRPRPIAPLVAAAASVAVIVGGTAYLVGGDDDPVGPPVAPIASSAGPASGSTSTPTSTLLPRSLEELSKNLDAARRAARGLLDLVPVMDGASRVPDTTWGTDETSIGKDPEIVESVTYSFPTSPDAVEEFLRDNLPPGLKLDPAASGETGSLTAYPIDVADGTSPVGPALLIQWRDDTSSPARSLVRFSATVSAR